MNVLNWILTNVLQQTSVIIGGVTLAGLVAGKKPFGEVIQGFLKTVVGYYIFFVGISAFVGVMNYFQAMVSIVFNVPAVELKTDFMLNYGTTYGPVILSGFLLHLLIERFIVPQKYRFVYMGGGHFLLRYSMLTTGIAVIVFGVKNPLVVFAFGTILSSLWYTIQPAIVHRFTKVLRGDDKLGYGHSSSTAVIITSLIAQKIGDPKDDLEEVKFPKGISFMRDMAVSVAIVQIILLVFLGILLGPAGITEVAGSALGGLDPWVWLVIQAITFSAGFMVVTFGIRTMINEILPAFSGFAEKIIPGTRPAMDVPTVFPFGPNSVLVGSTVCIFTFLVYMVIFNLLGWGTIVPIVPSLFMSGAGVAVFGNKFGGKKGAVLGGFIVATMMAFGLLLAWHLGYNLGKMEFQVLAGVEPDDFVLWPIIWGIGRLIFGAPLPAVP